MKKPVAYLAPILLASCLLAACEPWGAYENPGDPDAENYVGYPTVASSVDIYAVSAADGGTLTGAAFTICGVEGATGYELQIASSEAALAASAAIGNATNSFVLGASTIVDLTTYYWRARARDAGGAWSDEWSPVASFATRFLPTSTPTFNPPGGAYDANQQVSISCATPDAVIYYTLDGTAPTTASTAYPGSSLLVPVNPTTTIRAVAFAPFFSLSPIANAVYSAKAYAVGDTGPAGGIVFYDKGSFSNEWRYLEAAPGDQSAGVQWEASYTTTGANGTAVGTGGENTAKIVTLLGVNGFAAKLCADLGLGGFDDWFLPSKDELNLMYVNLKQRNLGNFATAGYWSSSEYTMYSAWYQVFDGSGQVDYTKGVRSYHVRAVRAF